MYRAKNKKIKFNRPRIRCPLCGFLGWLSCFEKEHPIEVKMQYTKGGRAKRDFVSYHDVYATSVLENARNYLLTCCKLAANRLAHEIIPIKQHNGWDEADRLEYLNEVIDISTKKRLELFKSIYKSIRKYP